MQPEKLKSRACRVALATLWVLGWHWLPDVARGQSDPRVYRGVESSDTVVPFVFEGPLTELPQAIRWRPGDPIKEIPRRHYFRPGEAPALAAPTPRVDPLLQRQADEPRLPEADGFTTPILDRDGQGFSGVNPPDTVGAVGIDHYIQLVNTASGGVFTVYNKADGSVAVGPIALDSLSPGGNCGVGLGDGIVLFDQLADRWLLTEFNNLGNSVCVYVSQESNPVTTSWFAYEFMTITFPDYPKYAVWPDAYYLSTNETTTGLYALDRASMLSGAPATFQRFEVPRLSGFGFQALTPGSLDGSILPPAGSPGLFMRHRDTEAHGPPGLVDTDILEIWEFSVDWTEPANSTLTGSTDIEVTDFDSELCGYYSFTCIPQPSSTVLLDPVREVLMFPLQYRSFGSYQTLVGNLVTDVDGTDHAGVRWFELRDNGSGWELHQEGTYAPDVQHRWMGSVSMDAVGNIALGYNVASATVSPSLRYTGRLAGDPLGMMGQPETELIAGSASSISNRYGDYSSMSVDPVDDCTFWFTGEYNSAINWSTRIGSFKFDDCTGIPSFILEVNPPIQQTCQPADAVFSVDVGSVLGFMEPVTLSISGEPAGSTPSFSPNPVDAGQASTLTVSGLGSATPGSYPLEVTGTAAVGTRMASAILQLSDGAPAEPELISPADGVYQSSRPTLTWTSVGGSYSIEIASDPGFTDIVDSATGVPTNSYRPTVRLSTGTSYYWRVGAENSCGIGPKSSVRTFITLPAPGDCDGNLVPQVEFYDSLEWGVQHWKSGGMQSTWSISTARSWSGANAWHAEDLPVVSDQYLVTPSIRLPTDYSPLTLSFWNWQEIESRPTGGCYDGAVVEISDDDGVTWTRLEVELLSDAYDGLVSDGFSNPIGGDNAWCGDPQDWLESIVDLDAWAGDEVEIRFRLATDSSEGRDGGWYVDDVAVTSCRALAFGDGFESGDTSRWAGFQ